MAQIILASLFLKERQRTITGVSQVAATAITTLIHLPCHRLQGTGRREVATEGIGLSSKTCFTYPRLKINRCSAAVGSSRILSCKCPVALLFNRCKAMQLPGKGHLQAGRSRGRSLEVVRGWRESEIEALLKTISRIQVSSQTIK